MKKVIFLILLLCTIIMQAAEQNFDSLFEEIPLFNQLIKSTKAKGESINRAILCIIYEIEKIFQSGKINEQKILSHPSVKEKFASDLKQCFTELDVNTCSFMQGMFYERKQYYLGTNKQKPIFFDEEIFKEIRPFIMNEHMIEKYTKEDKGLSYFGADGDHSIINQLIYKYNILTPHKAKAEKANQSILMDLIERMHKSGFFIGDIVYKGINPFIVNFGQQEIPYALPQTSEAQIEYLRAIFKPCLYGNFELKEFSGEVKKKVITFLLCLSHWKKKSKLIFPRLLLQGCILKTLAKYENAQRIRPILAKDVEAFEDIDLEEVKGQEAVISGVVEFIKSGRFLNWFDQEALR